MESNKSGGFAILEMTTAEEVGQEPQYLPQLPDHPDGDNEFDEADGSGFDFLQASCPRAGPAPFPTLQGGSTDCLELGPILQPETRATVGSSSMGKSDNRKAAVVVVARCSPNLNLPGRIKFCIRESPGMTRGGQIRFLRRFRLGDTYKLKTRSWLMPQFLSGALTLTGVVLTLVGIISLQINKYLHACDEEDGIDCKSNKADINNVMMPIGVGTTGGGLSLILISGFVFMHAFCFIYEDAENEEDGTHEGVLHIPVSPRAALLGSSTALSPEAVARCQSYYDNLQDFCAAD